MGELHAIFAFLNAAVAAVCLALAAVAWSRRAARGALWLALGMFGVFVWSGCAAAMWYTSSPGGQVFWLRATFLGVSLVPPSVLLTFLTVARLERWVTLGRTALLWAVALAFLVIRLLNPGGLYDRAFVARVIGSYTAYQSVTGPIYLAYNVFAFAMIGAGLVVILRASLRSSGLERTQAVTLFVGGLMPFVASAVTELGLVSLHGLDLAPVAFLGTGLLWLVAVSKGSLLDPVRVARGVLFEHMSDGVVVLDGEDRVADANPAALTMMGVSRVTAFGASVRALLGGVAGAVSLLDGSGPRHAMLQMGSDGDSHYVDMGITPLLVRHGLLAQLLTLHDVTEEQRATEDLKLARAVFDTANEGIVVMLPGADQRVIDVNEAFCRLTGRSRENSVGRNLESLQSDRHPPEFYAAIQQTLYTTGEWQGEVWQARADGTAFPSWLSFAVVKDGQQQVRHVVGIFTDITEINQQADETLRYHATHDALTGLPNRTMLDDRLEHALAFARRMHGGLAVLFIDLDAFKDVNDALGQAQGDAVLAEVANRLDRLLREADTVARRGGDEFTIILAGTKDPVQADVAVRRLLDAVAAPYQLDGHDLHITASAGVALFPVDGTDATSLVQHADLAMHRAKVLGRNRIQFFSEDFRAGVERRMAIARELWGADETARYYLLYQPQVDLSTGWIVGVEALVRLRARDGTVLSPAEFIPVAEDSELILQLGAWVLHRACMDLGTIHEEYPGLTMSVNFSARQFKEADAGALQAVLQTCGVDPRFLVVEITESALLNDPQEAAARLEELRGVEGLQLSLDDFGTGYSSLSYALMLHPDAIKIDRSFVELLPDDLEARAIVQSTIALATSLNAKSVAEGPETAEQVRFLQANGCDQAQGYYFSRPVPLDELMLLLGEGALPLPDVEATAVRHQ